MDLETKKIKLLSMLSTETTVEVPQKMFDLFYFLPSSLFFLLLFFDVNSGSNKDLLWESQA